MEVINVMNDTVVKMSPREDFAPPATGPKYDDAFQHFYPHRGLYLEVLLMS